MTVLPRIFRKVFATKSKAPLKARIAELQAQVGQLRSELRAEAQKHREIRSELERQIRQSEPASRIDRRDIDTCGHNSLAGMDSFFRDIPNRKPYEIFGERLRALSDQLGIVLHDRHVLDAGVGPAIALQRFLQGVTPASVTGWDFSMEAIRHARSEMPSATMEQRDLMQPFAERFDVVICTEVLEHLEAPEKALEHLHAGLSPGGQLLLTVPDGRLDITKLHINFWSPESWRIFIQRTLPGAEATFGTFNDNEAKTYRNNYALLTRSA